MKTLQVTKREVRKSDANGKNYAVLTLSTPNQVFAKVRGEEKLIATKPEVIRGITGFEQSNLPSLNDEPDFEWTLQQGDEVVGDRVTRKVEPYFIADAPKTPKDKQGPDKQDGKTGRIVNVATVAVFADTDDEKGFEIAVVNAFKRKGHTIVEAAATPSATPAVSTEGAAAESEASAAAVTSK